MKIEFNKVTWYSRLTAEIVFLLVIPVLAFYIGRQFESVITLYDTSNSAIISTP